jgi:hypothetical protein
MGERFLEQLEPLCHDFRSLGRRARDVPRRPGEAGNHPCSHRVNRRRKDNGDCLRRALDSERRRRGRHYDDVVGFESN